MSLYPNYYMATFCAEESSKQKDSKILRNWGHTAIFTTNFAFISYIVSFWCGNTLLEGDFKNTKTYQNMRGQQVARPLLFYLKKFNQIDN